MVCHATYQTAFPSRCFSLRSFLQRNRGQHGGLPTNAPERPGGAAANGGGIAPFFTFVLFFFGTTAEEAPRRWLLRWAPGCRSAQPTALWVRGFFTSLLPAKTGLSRQTLTA